MISRNQKSLPVFNKCRYDRRNAAFIMRTSLATALEGVYRKRIIINMFACCNAIRTGTDGMDECWFGAKMKWLVLFGNLAILKRPDCAVTLVG